MGNIEVTYCTFYKVINTTDFTKTDRLESAKKHHYYNAESEQRGIVIQNYTSSKTIIQYYLIDINA